MAICVNNSPQWNHPNNAKLPQIWAIRRASLLRNWRIWGPDMHFERSKRKLLCFLLFTVSLQFFHLFCVFSFIYFCFRNFSTTFNIFFESIFLTTIICPPQKNKMIQTTNIGLISPIKVTWSSIKPSNINVHFISYWYYI